MAVILDIADAVVAQLNATPFSQPLTAERHYQPRLELSAVQKKTDMSQASLDALMTLVEEIADHFRTQPLASYPNARCTEVKNEPVYALEHLDEFRQFTSVITLTYRVWR